MKKLLTILLILLMVCGLFSLTSCEEEYYVNAYSEYDLSEFVTLPDYDSYSYDAPVIEVTDEEIEERVNEWLSEEVVEVEVTEGTVEEGDTINISFDGVLEDGTTVDGMSSDSYEMTLGVTSMIDGFSESIYGRTIGEEYTVDLTFPDPYTNNTDLSGKGVTFTIKVLNKIVEETPELTDEWVKKNTDYKNVEKYKEAAKEEVYSEKETEAINEIKNEIYSAILEESEVSSLIEERVEYEVDLCDRWLHAYATGLGYDWETFLSAYYSVTTDDYDATVLEDAEEIVKADMIIYALAQKEEAEITQEDFDYYVDSLLESAGVDAETFEEYYSLTPEEYIHYCGYDYMLYTNVALDKIYERVVK